MDSEIQTEGKLVYMVVKATYTTCFCAQIVQLYRH